MQGKNLAGRNRSCGYDFLSAGPDFFTEGLEFVFSAGALHRLYKKSGGLLWKVRRNMEPMKKAPFGAFYMEQVTRVELAGISLGS